MSDEILCVYGVKREDIHANGRPTLLDDRQKKTYLSESEVRHVNVGQKSHVHRKRLRKMMYRKELSLCSTNFSWHSSSTEACRLRVLFVQWKHTIN